MGTKGREIVNLDVDKLLELLNKAYAEEWLAYYQYWVGAQVAVGKMRNFVVEELMEHAQEEFEHAGMVCERILQLGGTPLLTPQDLIAKAGCPYEIPSDPKTKTLVIQNINGERCAIATYKEILDFVEGKDPITYDLALSILKDEVEHEEDLEAILDDMEN